MFKRLTTVEEAVAQFMYGPVYDALITAPAGNRHDFILWAFKAGYIQRGVDESDDA